VLIEFNFCFRFNQTRILKFQPLFCRNKNVQCLCRQPLPTRTTVFLKCQTRLKPISWTSNKANNSTMGKTKLPHKLLLGSYSESTTFTYINLSVSLFKRENSFFTRDPIMKTSFTIISCLRIASAKKSDAIRASIIMQYALIALMFHINANLTSWWDLACFTWHFHANVKPICKKF